MPVTCAFGRHHASELRVLQAPPGDQGFLRVHVAAAQRAADARGRRLPYPRGRHRSLAGRKGMIIILTFNIDILVATMYCYVDVD